MGAGLGTSMQILVLIVQNSFHISLVGTATASNNYFRQIGASLGSAIIGSLFASRLMDILSQRLPGGSHAAGGITSLTPDGVRALPHALRDPILLGYNDALVPLFLYMVPLALLAFVLLCFLKEVPLATTIERGSAREPALRAATDRHQPRPNRGSGATRRVSLPLFDGASQFTLVCVRGGRYDPADARRARYAITFMRLPQLPTSQ